MADLIRCIKIGLQDSCKKSLSCVLMDSGGCAASKQNPTGEKGGERLSELPSPCCGCIFAALCWPFLATWFTLLYCKKCENPVHKGARTQGWRNEKDVFTGTSMACPHPHVVMDKVGSAKTKAPSLSRHLTNLFSQANPFSGLNGRRQNAIEE